jgi:hypothetical protein
MSPRPQFNKATFSLLAAMSIFPGTLGGEVIDGPATIISDTTPFPHKREPGISYGTSAKSDSASTPERPDEFSGILGHIIIPLIFFTGAIVGIGILVLSAVK